jgi:6-pyruvoyltetrahydropterin/6-carboxytetrahydropterin synthase
MAQLDRVVNEHVIRRFDHHDLNQDPEFSNRTTTGENLVVLIWDLLLPHLTGQLLQKVGVIETRDNYFEYSGSTQQATQSTGGRHG